MSYGFRDQGANCSHSLYPELLLGKGQGTKAPTLLHGWRTNKTVGIIVRYYNDECVATVHRTGFVGYEKLRSKITSKEVYLRDYYKYLFLKNAGSDADLLRRNLTAVLEELGWLD